MAVRAAAGGEASAPGNPASMNEPWRRKLAQYPKSVGIDFWARRIAEFVNPSARRTSMSTNGAHGIRQVGYFDCPGGGQVVVDGTVFT